MSHSAEVISHTPLSLLPKRKPAIVASVDWEALSAPESRRLRELGLDEGVEVEMVHGPGIFGGPVAARVGRMKVAMRPHVAAVIYVTAIAA